MAGPNRPDLSPPPKLPGEPRVNPPVGDDPAPDPDPPTDSSPAPDIPPFNKICVKVSLPSGAGKRLALAGRSSGPSAGKPGPGVPESIPSFSKYVPGASDLE